jgi:hypothetical protein
LGTYTKDAVRVAQMVLKGMKLNDAKAYVAKKLAKPNRILDITPTFYYYGQVAVAIKQLPCLRTWRNWQTRTVQVRVK